MVWFIFKDPFKAIVGPVGLVKIVGQHSVGFKEAFLLSGLISFAIGVTNALPFFPLDGGQLTGILLAKITKNPDVQKSYNKISGFLFVALIIFAFYSDFVNLGL